MFDRAEMPSVVQIAIEAAEDSRHQIAGTRRDAALAGTGPAVQGWIEATLKVRSAPTVRYKLAGNRHYWTWMAANGLASSEHNPFHGRLVKGQETAIERATNARTRFAPIDVPPLWIEAERYGDFDLYAAILLTAHQGWRLVQMEPLPEDAEMPTHIRCACGLRLETRRNLHSYQPAIVSTEPTNEKGRRYRRPSETLAGKCRLFQSKNTLGRRSRQSRLNAIIRH